MCIYSIYKFTNITTNKAYIGYTNNIERRLFEHKIDSTKPDKTDKFHIAIEEYGWDSFVFEILYQSKDKTHCEYIMEPYFIAEYDTFKNGYNSTNGKCQNMINYYMKLFENKKAELDCNTLVCGIPSVSEHFSFSLT